VADAGIVDAEIVEAELVEPEHDEAAFGTGAGESGDPAAPGGRGGSGGSGRPGGPSASTGGPGADPGPDAHDDEVLAAAAEAVEVDLQELLKEREQFLGAYQRTHADFENYRKQAQRRQDEAVQRAVGSFVEGLLPVLDACDAAVAHGAGDSVGPVLGALYGALEKEGLERIDPAGEPFDPAEAEAVMHEPGAGGEQVVAQVMRAGYRWRGRVLRPAMVKVTD
jgi:molecular chaperone GrpE